MARTMKVVIEPERGTPGYLATPVSKRARRACGTGSAYFQAEYELPEVVRNNRQYRYLLRGYAIVIKIDRWEYGNWLGEPACNAEW